MGDLSIRGNEHKTILANVDLNLKHKRIQLEEKRSQLANLDLEIEKLHNIQLRKLELAKDLCKKDIEQIESEINELSIGDDSTIPEAEFKITKEK